MPLGTCQYKYDNYGIATGMLKLNEMFSWNYLSAFVTGGIFISSNQEHLWFQIRNSR